MAMCDYKLCDQCGEKAFYDTNTTDPAYVAHWDPTEDADPISIAVLCPKCAKTYTTAVLRPVEITALRRLRAAPKEG